MQTRKLLLFTLAAASFLVLSTAAYQDTSLYQPNINRQSSSSSGGSAGGFAAGITQGIAGVMSGLVSSLPSMLTNAVPMLLMLGLGGLLLPLLGVSLFFREGQKRTFSLPSINPAILDGLADVLDRVTKAIEQGEKKYATKNN